MGRKFHVIIEKGEDGYLISEVVGLPGCHTQAKTYEQLIERTKEAIAVYLKENDSAQLTKFLKIEQIEV